MLNESASGLYILTRDVFKLPNLFFSVTESQTNNWPFVNDVDVCMKLWNSIDFPSLAVVRNILLGRSPYKVQTHFVPLEKNCIHSAWIRWNPVYLVFVRDQINHSTVAISHLPYACSVFMHTQTHKLIVRCVTTFISSNRVAVSVWGCWKHVSFSQTRNLMAHRWQTVRMHSHRLIRAEWSAKQTTHYFHLMEKVNYTFLHFLQSVHESFPLSDI